ncbi:MAG: 3-dehydroquinate synthase, partial [Nitrospirota bacterium]
MEKTRVELGERSYDIVCGSGLLGGLGRAVAELRPGPRVALVTNATVRALYGGAVEKSLGDAGLSVLTISIPDGEEYKSLLWAEKILTDMLAAGLDRGSLVVALGGGVVGDIAGFAASLYMRGIRFVQVPTTLLSQVDSSVGGKTGVNHPLGKNMIGTFWQPSLVWIDVDTLGTLPRRELLAGAAEVIKYGVIWDAGFFDFLSESRERLLSLEAGTLTRVITRSCEIKAEVVSRDEREAGLRSVLNYGHTIGHAIEAVAGYGSLLHGEALAIGMKAEAGLAESLGILPAKDSGRIGALIEAYGLPAELPAELGAEALLKA